MADNAIVDGVPEPPKADLRALVERRRAEWLDLVAEAGDRTDEPGPAGDWTLRDVVAHLNGYHRFLVGNLGGAARSLDDMPEEVGADVERRNQWMHQADLGLTWDAVTAESDQLHGELLAQIDGRSEDELRQAMVDWHPWPTWRWIVHLTAEHYDEHLPDMKRWLVGESP